MSQSCSKCNRINPAEALYCYHDGAILNGRGLVGGPVHVGAQPFPFPFVFPSGRACRNFNQLTLVCQENWPEAVELLQQGHLEKFLINLGRNDLAQAARLAAEAVDCNRGLDHLLGKVPTEVLAPPQLSVEPTVVNLGLLPAGENRKLDLNIRNLGMRLLQGSIAIEDSPWLSFSDKQGSPRKLFQVLGELTVVVHVRGKYLRASSKPLEGQLTVETNGGAVMVRIRAEVPVRQYGAGLFAGAVTPRQIAEKARANPKEAAPLFESGAVAQWYRDNAWSYPVRGPVANGVGAVQQFFEALGLTTPPKVEIRDRLVNLLGNPGGKLEHAIKVETLERRPVYAHGTSDKAWLSVGTATLKGRTAILPLIVAAVPERQGETLQATVTVIANGNQKLEVAVALAVSGEPQPILEVEAVDEPPEVLPNLEVDEVLPAVTTSIRSSRTANPKPRRRPPPPEPSRPRGAKLPLFFHLLPGGLIVMALVGVVLHDLSLSRSFADPAKDIGVRYEKETMRFGVLSVKEKSGLPLLGGSKQLTWSDRGTTNNTVLLIDGQEAIFGQSHGKWKSKSDTLPPDSQGRPRDGTRAIWHFDVQNVEVTQTVEIIPGEQTGEFDTCLIRYRIQNRDTKPHKTALRFLLDTYIGGNDGVPFTIPGAKGLCSTSREFPNAASVPDFIQALERPDLEEPGTVAHLRLKLGGKLENPSRVLLTQWPGWGASFQVPVLHMGRDSAVVIYWPERSLAPNQVREMGFTYGLGAIAGREGRGMLALTLGGSLTPQGEFTVTALVRQTPNQTITLSVPHEFQIIDGTPTQPVPPVPADSNTRFSPVTWKVRAGNGGGVFTLKVQTSDGVAQTQQVTIREARIFD